MKMNKSLLILLASIILLSACSEDESSQGQTDSGDLNISVTDAAGDFTQYSVQVTSLSLKKANGAVIETLPSSNTIDFAQYVDVTEFLTSATVPTGYYTAAEITLNYSEANLTVENELGESIPATAVDDEDNPLIEVTLSTQINSGTGFLIRNKKPASLEIDFDLEASNVVSINEEGTSATVTVNPILIANTQINDDKTRRARGLLKSVDPETESFSVDIRPFQIRNNSFGAIKVNTHDETGFEIDGISYSQTAGLSELDGLEINSPLVALGVYDIESHQFTASEVHAGSSVPWGDNDALKGSVIARSGNILTVMGATIEHDDGHFVFNDTVEVSIDEFTHVNKQGSNDEVSIDDISVGQKVMILGDMTGESTMDASTDSGIVRMRYSHLNGSVVTSAPLAIDLAHVNRRSAIRYDFTGSGTSLDSDADVDHYEVDTLTLDTSGLELSAPVKIIGFPTAFGTAPEDFKAKTIVDVSHLASKMTVGFGRSGAEGAISLIDESSLVLNLEVAGDKHHLRQAGIVTDLNTLDSVPVIQPAERALFSISQGRSIDVYLDWNGMLEQVNTKIAAGAKVVFVHSRGQYDSSENTLLSTHVLIRLTSTL